MKVLDLFAGLKGWSGPFEARGHECFSVELMEKFPGISLYADILTLKQSDIPWTPDIVLASPPCTTFSMMCVGKYWTHDHQPKQEKSAHALKMVEKTLEIMSWYPDAFFIIENPRAKLRKMPQMQHLERRTVWYCRYGEKRAKPTDLWGRFPPSLVLEAPCKNGNNECHIAAPRGSTTGTQGMDSAESAKIPAPLALAVCLAAEQDLAAKVAA